MQGKATVAHHPIHPMLVPFPIAFFIGSLAADIVGGRTKSFADKRLADRLIDFGIVSALVTAGVGLADYLTAPLSEAANQNAVNHLAGNVTVTGLYTLNRAVRKASLSRFRWIGYALSGIGVGGLLYSGFLGGTLVYENHVGVEEPRHEKVEPPRWLMEAEAA